MRRLTAKQQRYAEIRAADGSLSNAECARQAGYNGGAERRGHELARNSMVTDTIAKLREPAIEKRKRTRDELEAEMWRDVDELPVGNSARTASMGLLAKVYGMMERGPSVVNVDARKQQVLAQVVGTFSRDERQALRTQLQAMLPAGGTPPSEPD